MKKTVNDFVGKNNFNTVSTLAKWIENYYFEPDKVKHNYAILIGSSGNGKSYLCELLANSFNIELFRVTPNDITSKEDLYDIIKSVRIKTLSGKQHKLILIDDFDDYQKVYKNGLIEIGTLSCYPVIYTLKSYPYGLKEFANNSLKNNNRFLYVNKPLKSDLMQHFSGKLSDEELEDLIEKSVSFRGVMLGITGGANELIEAEENVFQVLNSMKKRELNNPIDRKNVKLFFDSVKGDKGSGKNILMVRQALNEYSYRTHVQHETIDPWEINNAETPFEKVSFTPVFRKRKNRNNNIKKEKKTRKKKLPSVEKTKVEDVKKKEPSLRKWF